jgi:hypothetical protein
MGVEADGWVYAVRFGLFPVCVIFDLGVEVFMVLGLRVRMGLS